MIMKTNFKQAPSNFEGFHGAIGKFIILSQNGRLIKESDPMKFTQHFRDVIYDQLKAFCFQANKEAKPEDGKLDIRVLVPASVRIEEEINSWIDENAFSLLMDL